MNPLCVTTLFLLAAWLAYAGEAPRERQNIDFDWRFHLGDVPAASAPEFADTSWRLLDVPHDFGAEGEFSRTNASGTAFLPGGIAWYRKAIVTPAGWQNKLVSVEFDGVSMNSEVWLNGYLLGKRPYAYSTDGRVACADISCLTRGPPGLCSVQRWGKRELLIANSPLPAERERPILY